MSLTIYTATGCTRCKITKKFMNEQEIAYEELDIKGDGMQAFRKFYGANRSAIYRGEDGVEFPVVTEGNVIRQGVAVAIAYLLADTQLDDFIRRCELKHEWIDGLHVSGGDPALGDQLIVLLKFLKKNGLKLQLDTNGKNASILEQLLEEGLGDRVVMEVKGPADLYPAMLAETIDPAEIEKSISLAARFPEYKFYTTVVPVIRQADGEQQAGYLTPEEISETAGWIESATGSKKHPFQLRHFDPQTCSDEKLNSIEALPSSEMFKYRTAARRHMVLAEIEKI
jgi:pyruvate-formate lyase-activating enzyme/glutaredoxin